MVGGTGTLTVTKDDEAKRLSVTGPPKMHQIVADDAGRNGHLEVRLSRGLQAYSFTYG
ncbi:hypothetical protein MPRM_10080 [Mycobacterium parmense]|uniref:DipZ thioredoxin-like C-terminal domain-containing protein n=1 Tax=Mycobacterium parmense TaxID=185642 RepID=A0A7I7YR18_9MYCO|nr:hypothetical protein MPRM_10080 [Mycobacterium parmense]